MIGPPGDGRKRENEGHLEETKFTDQAQTPVGVMMHHQPLPGYGVPPPYHHYPPAAPDSEAPLYYYPPPPPGYPYGPTYYQIPPPPPGYFYPPVAAPVPSAPKISPPSSTTKTKAPNIDDKANQSNKDRNTRDNEPSQSSSTSTDEEFLSKVKPMRSDFFIFASENKEKILNTIERDKGKSQIHIMTELNEKLLNMWEDLHSNMRIPYQTKEEEDRIRFMHEDEIESRHCATLTSRSQNAKSKDIERTNTNDDGGSMGNDTKACINGSNLKRSIHANNTDGSEFKGEEGEEHYESPPKKSK